MNLPLEVLSSLGDTFSAHTSSAGCGMVPEAVGAIALEAARDAALVVNCDGKVELARDEAVEVACKAVSLAAWNDVIVAPWATCSALVAATMMLRRMLKVFEGIVVCTSGPARWIGEADKNCGRNLYVLVPSVDACYHRAQVNSVESDTK